MSSPSKRFTEKDYFRLALWLVLGVFLAGLTTWLFFVYQAVMHPDVIGWALLAGLPVIVPFVLFIVAGIDLIYISLFLRWMFVTRKHPKRSRDDVIILK